MSSLNLAEITFPVYKLRHYNTLETIDKVTYIHTHWKSYVLDNKNLAGDTLGDRRLKIKEGELYPFKKIVKTPRDLVLNAKTSDVYIDNTGRLFSYQKTKRCTVKCYEIKKAIPVNSKVVLHVEGFPTVYVVPKLAYEQQKYITIVKYGDYYLLYSLEDKAIPAFTKRL